METPQQARAVAVALLRCCKSRLKDDRSYEHDWLDGVDDLMGSWARCLDGIDGLDGAVMVDW